jgi:non-heme chloroperoxidase
VFHHGWPLSSDDWDAQMLYFVGEGYRVVAHDRRGHGRSSQVGDGHDLDHYAADAAAVVEHLDVRDAIHVGHSTGGREAARYVARHGKSRVAKLVLIGAVPPIMVKTPSNPGGLPIEGFDGFRQQLAANREQFNLDVASGPFYGYIRTFAAIGMVELRHARDVEQNEGDLKWPPGAIFGKIDFPVEVRLSPATDAFGVDRMGSLEPHGPVYELKRLECLGILL